MQFASTRRAAATAGFTARVRGLAPALAMLTVVGLLAAVGAGSSSAARGSADAAGASAPIEIGSAANAYIEIGVATSASLSTQVTPPGSAEPALVNPDQVNITSWMLQDATEPDPSTNPAVDRITPRTLFMLNTAIGFGLIPLRSVECVSGRSANPTSDHPLGRACDFMYDYTTPAGLAAGWRAANWLVANQAALGVKYVIWQGLIWNATKRTGPWTTYTSTAYGCPNPANITGCHYDHVHVSMY